MGYLIEGQGIWVITGGDPFTPKGKIKDLAMTLCAQNVINPLHL